MTILPRRHFLKGLALSLSIASSGWTLLASAADAPLHTHPINDRITLITGAGGNVLVYKGTQGLTMVDSGAQAQSKPLLQLVDSLADGLPIVTLFNTHWHEDHTGGNEAVHARGAKIIAQENTKLWLGADFEVPWRQTHHLPRAKQALPDITFYTSGKMDLGSETVTYGNLEQAHTDGDLYVYFPQSNVLVTGGLLSNHQYPVTDIATGGWIGGLIQANEAMLAMTNEQTVFIPDRGPAMTRADLQAQYDMLVAMYEKMREMVRLGFSGHDMLKENITAPYDATWGDPEAFILETYRGMWAHASDMGGFI